METRTDYLKGPLFPLILRFSVPAAVSLLITAVYNIVDRIFVGNCVGTSALAGLSICFPLTYMMMAFGLNCSAGGASLFSLYAGQGRRKDMDRSLGCAVVLAVFFELALTAALLLFQGPLLTVLGVTDTALPYAAPYYRIIALGCLFQGLSQVFSDFIRVSGRPVTGMLVIGAGAVTNIVLDALFVAVLGWGVVGAAWATVTGQFLSAGLGAFFVFTGPVGARVAPGDFIPRPALAGRILSCGFAFWIAQMSMALVSLLYNSQLGRYGGDAAIGVYAVVNSIMTFVTMPASGISQGIQPIVGTNYGAGNCRRVMSAFHQGAALSVGITSFVWLAVLLFPRAILLAFGVEAGALSMGVAGLRLTFCITPALGYIMLATTFFQSLGRPVPSILLTLLRQVLFLIPFLYLFPLRWGVNGIFAAQPVSDGLALALAFCLIARARRQMLPKKGLTETMV